MQTAQNTYIALLLITTTANKEPGLRRCCVGGGAGPATATEQLIAGQAGGEGPLIPGENSRDLRDDPV